MKLSKNTINFGKHGSGKTSIIEAAASVSNSKYVERFIESGKEPNSSIFRAKIIYSTVDHLNKEIDLKIERSKLIRMEQGRPCILPPGDLEVIYCAIPDCSKTDEEDDVDFMMRVLNVDKTALYALADLGTTTIIPGKMHFEQANVYAGESEEISLPRLKLNRFPYYELKFKIESRSFFLSYDSLSGSEKIMLIIDLFITKAREITRQKLTLLLIDELGCYLDRGNFEKLIYFLANQDFQTIISLPPAWESEFIENVDGQKKT